MNKTVLIVGASRGIGAALVAKYIVDGFRVHYTVRNAEVAEVSGATRHICDVVDEVAMKKVAEDIGSSKLDHIVHVAGIFLPSDMPSGDASSGKVFLDNCTESFKVNTLGVFQSFWSFGGCLKRNGVFGVLTTRMGSIGDCGSGGHFAYRMSKCALNMGMVALSKDSDVVLRNITIVLLHPGWIITEMTKGTGNNTVEESAAGIKCEMDEIKYEDSGKFVHCITRETLEW